MEVAVDVPRGFRLWKQINEAQFTGGGEGVGVRGWGWGVCVFESLVVDIQKYFKALLMALIWGSQNVL